MRREVWSTILLTIVGDILTTKLKRLIKSLQPSRLSSLAAYLLKDEAISGKLIIGAVALALIAANSPIATAYHAIFDAKLSVGIGSWSLSMDLHHWITDGLMAFFFLVVGLELRRELDRGELSDKRNAVLPFAAALGGMLVPALIFTGFNIGLDTIRGWAIPTATDIALAIGILALLGKRIPSSIRIFLLTLAIVDDILAVIIIAAFYSSGIVVPLLFAALAVSILMFALRKTRYITLPVFVIAGIILWIIVYESGIHASIAGAILGLLAPLAIHNGHKSIAERVEKSIIPFSTLFVVPVFAFANTGISLSSSAISDGSAMRLASGIFFGLVIGKVVGISLATWIMVRLRISSLPANANWNHVAGVGMLAGIGFTVSIFVTDLAFSNESYIGTAKISIFAASAVSALVGYAVLRLSTRKNTI